MLRSYSERHQGDVAHELLPGWRRRRAQELHLSQARSQGRPGSPEPRPQFEVFVYSPRVEGVHLRFGAVARGGLRWSDRREDFRTEILGLVKAQMVKNAVIVPVGAKGGFYCKQLPDLAEDREAWLAEGVCLL
ncbi:MAG: NAD-glutamate dehydrogenase domain-containing protein [Nocardioidaceae bacterium]